MTRYWPQPRTGQPGEDAHALAGSRFVWFNRVLRPDGTGIPEPVRELSPDDRARLTALRPDLCGLRLDRPRIMGILNVTPDSFSDGGRFDRPDAAIAQARALAAMSDILDIGGESTRPGADFVPDAQEIARTVPVIEAIRGAGIETPISIDTRKAAVASAALDAGADMINDVSAMTFDQGMAALASERGVPICLMHAQGDPKTMQDRPSYRDVTSEVMAFLQERVEAALGSGIARDRIIVDPGIGFGKTVQHNVTLLQRLSALHDLDCAILLGASRKRFIGTLGDTPDAMARMPGSLAVALHGAAQGAQIIRVHDAAETRQALRLWEALNGQEDI